MLDVYKRQYLLCERLALLTLENPFCIGKLLFQLLKYRILQMPDFFCLIPVSYTHLLPCRQYPPSLQGFRWRVSTRRKSPASTAVSYTHLDVYKRQALQHSVYMAQLFKLLNRKIPFERKRRV